MSEAYVTDCDYCGAVALCVNDAHGGTCCRSCAEAQQKRHKAAKENSDK